MAWYREAKFGCFIHWGVYSVPAGEWKGKIYKGYSEHLMRMAKIPVEEYKNTLVKRAIADTGAPNLDSVLEGPNALVFSKELSAGPKVVAKFSRRHEHLVIRGGMGEGQAFDADQMKALAKLPDRNGLLSMFLSVLNAPIQKFAATVKAASEKDGGAPAPAAE